VDDLIATLKARLSRNPRLASIEQGLLEMLRPDLPIAAQQHLKPLWYKDRMELVLRGLSAEVAPVNLELVPSLECNLHCPHCTYGTWKARTVAERGSRLMPYERMVVIFDRLEAAAVLGVTITGGGEPFTNPDTSRGLQYAATKEFDTGVFSNGTLLDGTTIEELAELDLSFIRISLNSGECSSYLRFHGITDPAVFEAVTSNVELLGRALFRSPTTLGLAAIVNEVNVDAMPSIAEFVRRLYDTHGDFRLDYLAYRPVLNYGQLSDDLTRQISPGIAQRAIQGFERVKEILQGLPVQAKFAEDYFLAAARATQKSERGYSTCLGHGFCGSVAYDGGLYLCSERDGCPGYLLGSLLDFSLEEIWHSAQRRTVLDNIHGCGPACKVHRTNLLLHCLTQHGSLSELEAAEVQAFLDVIREAGEPDKLSFLSW
jgi:MoaA/NifB/PqqE/SkfB family radical SAM enzyme